jgi:hypothetical protein
MSRLSRLALVAVLSVGLLSSAASAQSTRPKAPPPNGGPTVCVAACPPPVSVGDDHRFEACGDKLAQLRRVTVGQVGRIDPRDVVHLVPLCDTVNHTLTRQQLTYLARGNVQGLVPTIGRNPTLMRALGRRGYAANDVIGIALGPRAAILYVSHR